MRELVIIGGYGHVPKCVAIHNKLSIPARLLYSIMICYVGGDENMECFPSTDTLADNMGLNAKTVFKLLNELEVAGLLQRGKKNPGTFNRVNKYKLYVPDPEVNKEYYTYLKPSKNASLPYGKDGTGSEGNDGTSPQGKTKNNNNKNNNPSASPSEEKLAPLVRHPEASPGFSEPARQPLQIYSELEEQKLLITKTGLSIYYLDVTRRYPKHNPDDMRETILRGFKWLHKNPNQKKDEILFMDKWIENAVSRSEIRTYNYPARDHEEKQNLFIDQIWNFFGPSDDGLTDLN